MESEDGYISKFLTHFVGAGKSPAEQYAILKKILASRWLTHPPHDEQPTLGLAVHLGRKASSNELIHPDMICFCDIRLPHLKIHTRKYGQFGIAFRKDFLIAQGASPVFYIARGSGLLRRKPEFRKGTTPRESITPEEYEKRKKEPLKAEQFAFEQRGEVFDEHMDLLWRLWYEKEKFENGAAGDEVAALMKEDKALWLFLVTHVLGYIKLFHETLPDEHPDNYYMEREWRKHGNLNFAPEDVAAVLVPDTMLNGCRRDCPEYADRVTVLPNWDS